MKSAIILELLGIATVFAGISIELVFGADAGFVLISTGSLFIAAGAMLYTKVFRR